MFIATTKNGGNFVEGSDFNGKPLTWDDVPDDGITSLCVTHPSKYKDLPSPMISIGRFDKYFFYNEATTALNTVTGEQTNKLVAKIIAGIDEERNLVVEARVDFMGNVSFKRYSYEELKSRINMGQFRESSIRKSA